MPEIYAGATLAVGPSGRDAVPDEHIEDMLRSHLTHQQPGIRDITFRWLWQDATGWEDDDGVRHDLPAHWVLFAEGTVST